MCFLPFFWGGDRCVWFSQSFASCLLPNATSLNCKYQISVNTDSTIQFLFKVDEHTLWDPLPPNTYSLFSSYSKLLNRASLFAQCLFLIQCIFETDENHLWSIPPPPVYDVLEFKLRRNSWNHNNLRRNRRGQPESGPPGSTALSLSLYIYIYTYICMNLYKDKTKSWRGRNRDGDSETLRPRMGAVWGEKII